MNHYELCQAVAAHQAKKADVVIYEYSSFASAEAPDVLTFKDGVTTLFEIKTSRADFLRDSKKEARSRFRVKYFLSYRGRPNRHSDMKEYFRHEIKWGKPDLQEFIQEEPHLGLHRYFVCEPDIIMPEDVGDWGLIYFKNGKMFKKKESKRFRRNIHAEMRLLCHIMRKYASGYGENIIVRKYSDAKT